MVLAALSILVAVWSLMRAGRSPTRQIARLVVTVPRTDELSASGVPSVALAPNSSHVVYAASHGGGIQLYVRAIDSFEATPIPGTEGAEGPFFSPDGQSVGFFAEGKLKKVPLSGGAPLTLCSASAGRGASWGPDDAIIFAPSTGSGLYRVPAVGGAPKPLTVPDRKKGEFSHRWPEILPGGKALLFTILGVGEMRIGVLSLETGDRRVLVEGGTYPQYAPSGHVVYARAGGLLAVPFDLRRLEVTGPSVSILEGVDMNSVNGSVNFSSSADGSLAYVPGTPGVGEGTLRWVDRNGTAQPLPTPPRAYLMPRLSPDGQQLALFIEDTNPGLWLYDLARGTLTRLTASVLNSYHVWTRDSKRVTFRSGLSGPFNLDWMPVDGSGSAERLTTAENLQVAGSWSPDGQVLAFSEQDPATGWDIWVLKLEGERKAQPFLRTPSNENGATFSPDGRWLAYQSDESGQYEIYVRPFPGPGGKWQISTEGGTEPVWARNGRELFYRSGNKMMIAAIETGPMFVAAKPQRLFEGNYATGSFRFDPNYDVTADGQRFLMIKKSERESAAPTQINVVLNWFEELKRRVPANQ
jgi:Tol biopolymer transport system component